MPTGDGGGLVYPFGRWSHGYVLDDLNHFVAEAQLSIRLRLTRAAWLLFLVLFALTVVLSTRHFGGPYISLEMRPVASTVIVSLPAMFYFIGRRFFVYVRVRGNPAGSYLGRLFVWSNIDNAFGAAVRHPDGAYVVAPWLDAGRKYRLDSLSEQTARRVVWGSIGAEITLVCVACAVLIGVYEQAPNCIYGVSLYFSVLQPVLAGVEMHVLMPLFAQRWHPRAFDDAAIIAKRYRWLRVYVISSAYMAVLLLTRGPQSLHVREHEPMQTYLYLAAYATATCYSVLSLVCLVKTWARPWSVRSLAKSLIARAIFLLTFFFLAASLSEPIKSDYFAAVKSLTSRQRN